MFSMEVTIYTDIIQWDGLAAYRNKDTNPHRVSLGIIITKGFKVFMQNIFVHDSKAPYGFRVGNKCIYLY